MREKLKQARVNAGLTQEKMAEKLHVGLRHYQKIEAGDSNGSFEIWDSLEDLLGVHQRILREMQDIHHAQGENQQGH